MNTAKKLRLGVIMDPIEDIKVYKDSSFAMLLAAQKRGWELYYILAQDLFAEDTRIKTSACRIRVEDNTEHWFDLDGHRNHRTGFSGRGADAQRPAFRYGIYQHHLPAGHR